jgi:hypothetical protein
MADEFRYDVAFSFLAEHESLALRLKDGLTDRLTAFVYSHEQPDIVGRNTDGLEAFTNVFRYESRVCVVLHSDGWGKTKYTRVEESAIKERAGELGWDFLIVVRLDKAVPPKWLPSTKIWYGYEKYGLEGLLATIDNRVTELGGRPKDDSVLEKAARTQRERDFLEAQRMFASSSHGSDTADAEVNQLRQHIRVRAEAINKVFPDLELTCEQNDDNYRSVAVAGTMGSFVLYWQRAFSNTLTSAAILVVEWGGRFSYQGNRGVREN